MEKNIQRSARDKKKGAKVRKTDDISASTSGGGTDDHGDVVITQTPRRKNAKYFYGSSATGKSKANIKLSFKTPEKSLGIDSDDSDGEVFQQGKKISLGKSAVHYQLFRDSDEEYIPSSSDSDPDDPIDPDDPSSCFKTDIQSADSDSKVKEKGHKAISESIVIQLGEGTSIISAEPSQDSGVVSRKNALRFEVDDASFDVQVENPIFSPDRGSKRKVRHDTWELEVVKKKRNSGEEYISRYSKMVVPKKTLGPECNDGCFGKIGRDQCKEIFDEFWATGDYNIQTGCLISCIEKVITGVGAKRKAFTGKYFVKTRAGRVKICRKAFQSIHGISAKRVQYLNKKMGEHGTPIPDKRGKTSGMHRRLNPDSVAAVHRHIQSLPVRRSHYSRAKSENRQYLPSKYTVSELHRMYLDHMEEFEPDVPTVKFKYY